MDDSVHTTCEINCLIMKHSVKQEKKTLFSLKPPAGYSEPTSLIWKQVSHLILRVMSFTFRDADRQEKKIHLSHKGLFYPDSTESMPKNK